MRLETNPIRFGFWCTANLGFLGKGSIAQVFPGYDDAYDESSSSPHAPALRVTDLYVYAV